MLIPHKSDNFAPNRQYVTARQGPTKYIMHLKTCAPCLRSLVFFFVLCYGLVLSKRIRSYCVRFVALLALCAGNSPATSQRPMTRSLYILFDLGVNKCLSKRSRSRWFHIQACPPNCQSYVSFLHIRWIMCAIGVRPAICVSNSSCLGAV